MHNTVMTSFICTVCNIIVSCQNKDFDSISDSELTFVC